MAAVLACTEPGQVFEQTCTRCHDPNLRQQWGCDEPVAEPTQWLTPCPFCAGSSEDCEHCKGSNQIPILRCPRKTVTQQHLDTITAAALVEQGVLPDRGGWQDQPATFVRAYPICAREIAHWRAYHREQAAKKAEGKR